MGTLKDRLILVGSLFVISGNPLESGSMNAADNQEGQRMEEEMNACPCTTEVAVDLTVIIPSKAPWAGPSQIPDCKEDTIFLFSRPRKCFVSLNCINLACKVR